MFIGMSGQGRMQRIRKSTASRRVSSLAFKHFLLGVLAVILGCASSSSAQLAPGVVGDKLGRLSVDMEHRWVASSEPRPVVGLPPKRLRRGGPNEHNLRKAEISVSMSRNMDNGSREQSRILRPVPGERRQKVVFATLQNNPGTCRADNSDWRGTLPRYIARNYDVFVWNAKDSLEKGISNDCRRCFKSGYRPSTVQTFNCTAWFRNRGHAKADAVVVLGTGISERNAYPQLEQVFRQSWVDDKTRFIHIPISRNQLILSNKVAKFDKVVADGEWVKPVRMQNLGSFLSKCKAAPKVNSLAWVARYVDWKGQKTFLQSVDPKLLKGYRLEFFASQVPPSAESYIRQMKQVAAERGIRIVLHKEALDRQALLRRLCRAKGLVHYARGDANPRALYEAFLARLPAFITYESRIPRVVQVQPFVAMTHYAAAGEGHSPLNHDLSQFMGLIRSQDQSYLRHHLDTFINTTMVSEQALSNMCGYMGLC